MIDPTDPSLSSGARRLGEDRGTTPSAVLRLVRPRQWIKNLLVFAGPAAAGVLDEPGEIARTSVVFVAFCLAAGGVYCLNDAADAAADRHHPTKGQRPVAAGEISARTARLLGLGLIASAIGLGSFTGSWEVAGIIAAYLALTVGYTYVFKHIAVVDIVAVTCGFVIRAVAGVVGTDIPLSDWYLIVASFGSLFLVAGKRSTELRLGVGARSTRPALASYSNAFLQYVRAVSSGVVLLAYCLWAFERAEVADTSIPWFQLSIVPFVLLVLRYAMVHEANEYEGPEDIVLGDRPLQVIGLVWAVVFACGVYLGDAPPLTG
ncbi:MAG: decaprenyl-phosphate phosphoribosyltransferase [Acidimicrobiales bacterium]